MRSVDELRRLREELGLSQEALARIAGVTVGSLSRWERGAVRPSRLILRGLQGFLADYRAGKVKENG